MPYRIEEVEHERYRVVNADTGKVHAYHTTKAKAEAQVRLLEQKEHPRGLRVRRG